jgi:hypothetical protein
MTVATQPAATQTAFDVVPLTRHIGAEIRGLDLHDTLDADTTRRLRRPGSITRCCCSAARRSSRRICCG